MKKEIFKKILKIFEFVNFCYKKFGFFKFFFEFFEFLFEFFTRVEKILVKNLNFLQEF